VVEVYDESKGIQILKNHPQIVGGIKYRRGSVPIDFQRKTMFSKVKKYFKDNNKSLYRFKDIEK
jgi:hypothetical protein